MKNENVFEKKLFRMRKTLFFQGFLVAKMF